MISSSCVKIESPEAEQFLNLFRATSEPLFGRVPLNTLPYPPVPIMLCLEKFRVVVLISSNSREVVELGSIFVGFGFPAFLFRRRKRKRLENMRIKATAEKTTRMMMMIICGRTWIGRPETVAEGGGVDERVRSAVGEVAGGWAGERGGAGGAGGAVEEGLVAGGGDAAQRRRRNGGLEVGSGGEVHASAGDPVCSEPAAAADVEIREVAVDDGLVRVPARLRGVRRGEERAGAAEVLGEDEAEALDDVVAAGAGVVEIGSGQTAEGVEGQGADGDVLEEGAPDGEGWRGEG
ncbi:imidazole glycerol phosphate synthase subunit HisH [Striga asiatica]|uniref:Imidazole glycerol phosphate synthase subunit HisH n=1 Tax=Striga asiatica TaxID=4170 RepID=A0A5A7P187_STRAF|nr:imidazole glycerol phosphate synthase subunit HisH [Striga asiatica]